MTAEVEDSERVRRTRVPGKTCHGSVKANSVAAESCGAIGKLPETRAVRLDERDISIGRERPSPTGPWGEEEGMDLCLKRDLESTDLKKRAQEMALQAGGINAFANTLRLLPARSACATTLRDAKTGAMAKRAVLASFSRRLSRQTSCPEQGGETWRQLWDAAGAFATSASTNIEDAAGTQCPLCQQTIHEDVATRLKHLAEFVKVDATAGG